MMKRPFDIFRIDKNGVCWLQSAASLEDAEAQARQAAGGAAGEYLVLNQVTGSKVVLKLEGSVVPGNQAQVAPLAQAVEPSSRAQTMHGTPQPQS